MMKQTQILLTIALLAFITSFAHAQGSGIGTRISLYYMMNNWKTDYGTTTGSLLTGEDKVKEGVFGLNMAFVPTDRLRFDLSGASTSSKYTDVDKIDSKLSSINDTKIRGTYFVSGGKASASVYANLPTGKKKLDEEQYLVAQAVADNSRKLNTRRFGQGFDIGTDWFVLPEFGEVKLQIGGGYLYKGKYQPLNSDTRKYKYGDEISGRFGVSYDHQPVGFSGGVTIKHYRADVFGDNDVFQAGLATSIGAAVFYNETFNLSAGFSILNRGKAKIRSGGEEKLSDESIKSGRNELLLYLSGGYPATPVLRLLGRIEYQSLGKNDYEKTDWLFRPKSNYLGLSGGASYAITPALGASGLLTLYSGKIDENYDLSGMGLALALTYRAM